jgi:CMD domain protein
MTAELTDLVDGISGIAPGSRLDALRAARPAARTHTQESYRVLFTPDDPGDVTPAERFALGTYVAGLHGATELRAHYAAGLAARASARVAEAVDLAIAATQATGPSGRFPPGPLSVEDTEAPVFDLPASVAVALGPRLPAAFAHAHLLVFHPRDAAEDAFAPLFAAGWTTTGLVTLSQIVAFLAYQIRVVAGLRVLAARS